MISTAGHRRVEGGSATVWMLAVMLALGLAASLVLTRGVVALTRHRAASVADLAAVAAATHGGAAGGGCPDAARLVAVSGAVLLGCRIGSDGSADVVVGIPMSGPWAPLAAATVRARAGPAAAG